MIKIQSRLVSDPTLSDIDFENKRLGSQQPLNVNRPEPDAGICQIQK